MVLAEQSRGGPAEWIPAALAGIGVGVIVVDRRGDVLFMSPAAEALTGWSRSEAVGRALADVFRTACEAASPSGANPAVEVFATGAAVPLTDGSVLSTRDGRQLRIEQGAAPIRNAAGTTVAVVLIFSDIGQRRQAAQEAGRRRLSWRSA